MLHKLPYPLVGRELDWINGCWTIIVQSQQRLVDFDARYLSGQCLQINKMICEIKNLHIAQKMFRPKLCKKWQCLLEGKFVMLP
jgi:hypothetical protein